MTESVSVPMINAGTHAPFSSSHAVYTTRTLDIMSRVPVIDMLAPLTLDFSPERWAETLNPSQAARYRDSGLTALHHSIATLGPDAYCQTLHYLAAWNGFAARNSDLFLVVDRGDDIDKAQASGKIAIIMGLQNSEHFRTPADVLTFRRLGQRCSQLTYNTQNLIGSGCTDRVDGGLSDFGVEIVKAMNAARMLVDVSHCGDRTTLDAIEVSSVPIAITHANCRALNDHPRLKSDEAIRKLAAAGGVLGITGIRNFVSADEPTTIDDVVRHIEHVARLVGIEHVGVGSDADLDGYDKMKPEYNQMIRQGQKPVYGYRDKIDTDGFDSPKRYFDLVERLVKRRYVDEQIEMIIGGNFNRLLKLALA